MVTATVIISFLIAALSGMGVGGGGLFVIFLALFTDIPQLTVQGINLVYFIICSGASLLIHLRKRKIFVLAVVIMSLSGLAGAFIGSLFSAKIDQSLLRKIFGAMLIISGNISLYKALSSSKRKKEKQRLSD